MEKLKTIHDISAFYFFVLSAVYIIAALSLRNQFLAEQMMILVRILDLPFIFICLCYGGSALAIQLYNEAEERFSKWAVIIFALCVIGFLAALFINFMLPNQW